MVAPLMTPSDIRFYTELQLALDKCQTFGGGREGSYFRDAALFLAIRVDFPFLCDQVLKPPYFFPLIPRFDVMPTATGDEVVFNAPKGLSHFIAAYRACERYGKGVKCLCLLFFVIYIKCRHYLAHFSVAKNTRTRALKS